MPNPATPLEKKQLLGNPGRRPLTGPVELPALTAGPIDPLRPLEWAGQQLWDSVFKYGGLWVSNRTDTTLLQMTCEQLDRREALRAALVEDPTDRQINMSINEVEKLITSNLGLLGFTPADRSRLGFTLAKTESKLEQLQRRKAENVASTMANTDTPESA